MKSNYIDPAAKKSYIDNLLTYEFNLNNQLETLRICENTLEYDQDIPPTTQSQIKMLIQGVTKRIDQELTGIRDFLKKIGKTRDFSSSQQETFNLITLRYNKLILQVEKIYICTPQFTEITNQIPQKMIVDTEYINPFIQNQTGSSKPLLSQTRSNSTKNTLNRDDKVDEPFGEQNNYVYHSFTRPNNFNTEETPQANQKPNIASIQKLKPAINYNTNIANNVAEKRTLTRNNSSNLFRASTPNNLDQDQGKNFNQERSRSPLFYQFNDIKNLQMQETVVPFDKKSQEIIQKDIATIQQLLIEVQQEIQTHQHQDYEQEMQELRIENQRIGNDYRVLQSDNTEILHSINVLSRLCEQLKTQNQRIFEEINQIQNQRDGPLSQNTNNFIRQSNNNNNNNNNQNVNFNFDSDKKQHYKFADKNQQFTEKNFQTTSPAVKRTLIPTRESKQNEDENELLSSWVLNKLGKR